MPRTKTPLPPANEEEWVADDSIAAMASKVFEDDLVAIEEVAEPDLSSVPPIEVDPNVDNTRVVDMETGQIKPVSEMEGAKPDSDSAGDVPLFGKPDLGDMVTVRGGGLYLPARRRVVWMRGEPKQHPDWTIDTYAEEIARGTFNKGKVEGGYARYRASIYNEVGRLIATGTKTEFSERFMDFAEKAETGAIGRALAVAGYGTEAAIDLDEGLEQDRIADAPVAVPGRAINITPSAVPGVRVGGRPAGITEAQVKEVARLARTLGLGMGLIPVMEEVADEKMGDLEEGEDVNKAMLRFMRTFTFEQGGDLVQRLASALAAKMADTEEA